MHLTFHEINSIIPFFFLVALFQYGSGGLGGVILLLCCTCCAVYCCHKQKQKRKRKQHEDLTIKNNAVEMFPRY